MILLIQSIAGCNSTQKMPPSSKREAKKENFERKLNLSSSDRILIVAPHPDDESLACAGIIARAVKKKIPVLVVLMTNGDGYLKEAELSFRTFNPTPEEFRKIGIVRHLETIRAMKLLGLDVRHIIFLCYPDGGINSLFNQNWDYDKLHKGLNGCTYAPYSFAYQKKARYCGENVVNNLEKIISDFKPTIIFYPDPGDDHHDHWATSAFLEYVTTKIRYRKKTYTYLVHKEFYWPFPWEYVPQSELLPPEEMKDSDAHWILFPLSEEEEKLKFKAISSYASQKKIMLPYLEAFVRKNELFAFYRDIKTKETTDPPDFFSGKSLPHTVIRDAARDLLSNRAGEYGDLVGVSLAYDKNKIWLALETTHNIIDRLVYWFHLRIFTAEKVSRIDIKIENGKASTVILANNSLNLTSQLRVNIKNNRLVVEMPSSYIRNADYVILNADTFLHNKKERVDRTAWRRIKLNYFH